MHQSRGFDPVTGVGARRPAGAAGRAVFGEELVRHGEQRDDIVAITAAMCEPTGLGEFGRRFPRPLLRRRHRRAARADLGGRAGLRRDAPGRRDLCHLPQPRLRPAADGRRAARAAGHRRARPRRHHRRRRAVAQRHVGPGDARRGARPADRRAARRDRRCGWSSPRRWTWRRARPCCGSPRRRSAPDLPARAHRRHAWTCWSRPGPDGRGRAGRGRRGGGRPTCSRRPGPCARPATRSGSSTRAGCSRCDPAVLELAARADLVVTVEDGIVVGGVGSRISQEIRRVGLDVACREIGIPAQFLAHGKVADVRAAVRFDGSGASGGASLSGPRSFNGVATREGTSRPRAIRAV